VARVEDQDVGVPPYPLGWVYSVEPDGVFCCGGAGGPISGPSIHEIQGSIELYFAVVILESEARNRFRSGGLKLRMIHREIQGRMELYFAVVILESEARNRFR
jgi:hypothetical protein